MTRLLCWLACSHTLLLLLAGPRYIARESPTIPLKNLFLSARLLEEVELVTAEPGTQQAPEVAVLEEDHTATALEGAAASSSASSRAMSLGSKSFPARRGVGQKEGGGERGDGAGSSSSSRGEVAVSKKEPRFDRCFSGLDLRIGPGPLRDMDAGRLKVQIRKWAKAVVSYARQISFGSPRSRPAAATSPSAAAATLPAANKSGLGGATREEPPT